MEIKGQPLKGKRVYMLFNNKKEEAMLGKINNLLKSYFIFFKNYKAQITWCLQHVSEGVRERRVGERKRPSEVSVTPHFNKVFRMPGSSRVLREVQATLCHLFSREKGIF